MEKHNFRTLAPAATQHSPPRKPDLNLKRKRTSVACDACRQKRAGCDGVRPACTACQKRQSQCTYMNQEDQEMRPTILKRENTTLREKIAAYGEIICLLENIPQTTVQDILRRLRTGSDPAVILRSLKSENFATTPSAQRMARSILPPIQSNCEFELLIRHPSAFPLVDLSQHAQATGNTLVRPRRSSTPQATLSHSPSSTLLPHDPPSSDQATGLFALGDLGASKRSRNSAEPKPPQYFDPRLAHLKIDFWTTVPISNEQAAGAISLYLEAQHHVWGAFDAGLFVRDLIEFRLDFCSPFMVSSLLAMACLYDAPLDPKGSKNSYAFEKEAVKLFQSEDNVDSLPTIAGLVLLYVSLAVHGEGMRGMQFLTAALQAAERMKLFGVPEVHEELSSASPETLVATSATAWGLFNMIIHAVRFYLMSPIVYPPKLPMPAELSIYRVPRQDATRESIALREKLVEMDKVLSNFAKIWTVLNQVYLIYRGQEGSGGSLAFALSKYSRILQLANELPQTMDRSRRTTNHVLIFHMTIHTAILDIFRPFIASEQQHRFRSYLPQGASPTSIFAASVKQLKSLIFEYTYQYQPTQYNQMFPDSILYAANAVLHDRLDPERRPYFFFYMQLFHVFGSMGGGKAVNVTMQALLAIAHDKGAISSTEATQFTERLKDETSPKENEVVKTEHGWTVDMDHAIAGTAAANVDQLAHRFEEITLFNEFTEGVV